MNAEKFTQFFDNDIRLVKEHEFRKAVFKGRLKNLLNKNILAINFIDSNKLDGILDSDRSEIWKYLFDFYSFNSTPRERQTRDKERSIEYFLMKLRWLQLNNLIENNQNDLEMVNVPLIPFNININLEENVYKSSKTTTNQENHQVNVDYIKIQLILQISKQKISLKKLTDDIRQIDKDVERTSYLTEIENQNDLNETSRKRIADSLRNVLITFAAFNQNLNQTGQENNSLGYTQGMNELASVFINVFNDESVAYWCFSNFMLFDTSSSDIALHTQSIQSSHVLKTSVAHYFSDLGMSKKLKYLSGLLKQTDLELYEHLEVFDMENLFFCHEWLILSFKRCFKTTFEYERCFEMLASHYVELNTMVQKNISVKDLYSFDLFICLALLKQMRDALLNKTHSEIEIIETLRNNNNILSAQLIGIFKLAEEIFDKYCVKQSLPDENENKNIQKNVFTEKIKKLRELMFN